MKEDMYVISNNGSTSLHMAVWKPEGEVKAVLQIVHGMNEYIDRYFEFAEFLTTKGIAVIGIDQLGHGKSAKSVDEQGFFGNRGGKKTLLLDQYMVTNKARDMFPGVPVIIMGHSFGSFVTRRYLTIFGKEVDGAIIMGTGYHNAIECNLGMMVSALIRLVKGAKYRSKFINKLSEGSYDTKFKLSGKGSWLTKDNAKAKAFDESELRSAGFTVSAYYTMFSLLKDLAYCKNYNKIPVDLPILIVSGMDDPVGNYTKGVLKVYNSFIAHGLKDVDMKFYENDRHELLNETDRADVFDDLYAYIRDIKAD